MNGDMLIRRWPGVIWLRLWIHRGGITFHGERFDGVVVQHSIRIGPFGVGAAWLRRAGSGS